MPDGEYIFGALEDGEPIIRREGVGIMPDGQSLASGVVGIDQRVRTFHHLTGDSLFDVIHLAYLTPARIIGWDHEVGSITTGKWADLVLLDGQLQIQHVYRPERPSRSRESLTPATEGFNVRSLPRASSCVLLRIISTGSRQKSGPGPCRCATQLTPLA